MFITKKPTKNGSRLTFMLEKSEVDHSRPLNAAGTCSKYLGFGAMIVFHNLAIPWTPGVPCFKDPRKPEEDQDVQAAWQDMGVSKNNGIPKSSGFSIINHPFGGFPCFRKHPHGIAT